MEALCTVHGFLGGLSCAQALVACRGSLVAVPSEPRRARFPFVGATHGGWDRGGLSHLAFLQYTAMHAKWDLVSYVKRKVTWKLPQEWKVNWLNWNFLLIMEEGGHMEDESSSDSESERSTWPF